jgi:hypothetical protein
MDDGRSVVNTWQPNAGDAIQGELDLDDERPRIRTDDGDLWQLPDDAAERVLELGPEKGRRVVVMYQGEDPADGAGLYSVATP